jgi:DNA-binding NtrC family response regulator
MPSTAGVSHYQMQLEAVEQEVLREALQAHNGDKRAAARALGLGLSTLYAKLKKYRL